MPLWSEILVKYSFDLPRIVCTVFSATATAATASKSARLVIGDTFTIDLMAVKETRRINVYLPAGMGDKPLPVMYMPDGGVLEDFLHVARLLQVGSGNGTTRPFSWSGSKTPNGGAT